MTNLPKCPFCYSQNIEPLGTHLFQCLDCKKHFSEAVVEIEPQEPKKGGKK